MINDQEALGTARIKNMLVICLHVTMATHDACEAKRNIYIKQCCIFHQVTYATYIPDVYILPQLLEFIK